MSAAGFGSDRHRRRRLVAAFVPTLAGIATAAVSWQRWIMPFIDGSREMNVPARLAAGERLYRDVVYHYGPIGPWLGAAFIRILGRRWTSIEVLCAIVTLVLLASMFRSVREAGSRRAAVVSVTAAAVIGIGAPNGGAFLFPYSVDSLIALAACMAAVALLGGERPNAVLAAVSLGIAIGARVEIGVPFTILVAIAGARWRDHPGMGGSGPASSDRVAALSGLLAGAAIWAVALAGVPLGDLRPEGPGALFSPPAEWRQVYSYISGLDDPAAGLARVATGTFLLGLMLGAAWLARRSTRLWIALTALGVAVLLTPLGRAADAQWPSLFSVVPVGSVVLAVVLFSRPRSPGAKSGFLLCALAAIVGSRVLLRLAYGQETTPYSILALPPLFAVAAVALIDLVPARVGPSASGFRRNASWLFAGVAAAGFLRTARLHAPSRTVRLETPAGEIRLPPAQAVPTQLTIDYLRRRSSAGDGLVGFPEAGFFNFVVGLRNPLREEQILPGHLTDAAERRVVDRFLEARPRFVVLVGQPARAFGRVAFGEDYAKALWAAVRRGYLPAAVFGADRPDPRIGESGFFIEIFERPGPR